MRESIYCQYSRNNEHFLHNFFADEKQLTRRGAKTCHTILFSAATPKTGLFLSHMYIPRGNRRTKGSVSWRFRDKMSKEHVLVRTYRLFSRSFFFMCQNVWQAHFCQREQRTRIVFCMLAAYDLNACAEKRWKTRRKTTSLLFFFFVHLLPGRSITLFLISLRLCTKFETEKWSLLGPRCKGSGSAI
jgi:hypothetical protein